ncbi:MAG: GNAT family N-acetyltransferase [Lautropia sp.]
MTDSQRDPTVPRASDPAYAMRVLQDLSGIDMATWNALVAAQPSGGHPFVDWRFLRALETSASVGGRSGWRPAHVVLERHGEPIAAAPLYRKSHSYGEYVFDWAWADAYRRHGLSYYPKGLVAAPFTPVPGPRLLARDDLSRRLLVRGLLEVARANEWSSLHLLFPEAGSEASLREAGLLERHGVQFHWQNPGWRDFADFVSQLTQPKRKKILAERRKVRDAGIRMRCIEGADITEADWDFFYRCYETTYEQHHSTPYLRRAFFSALSATMPEHLLLFVGTREHASSPIAASLLFRDEHAIYGRYWGAIEYVPCLHFEASYYAPIEWAIERGIRRFEGGAQGEHKMARGFLPVPTRSWHWLDHPAFNDAVSEFLVRERGGIDAYLDELEDRNPIRPGTA